MVIRPLTSKGYAVGLVHSILQAPIPTALTNGAFFLVWHDAPRSVRVLYLADLDQLQAALERRPSDTIIPLHHFTSPHSWQTIPATPQNFHKHLPGTSTWQMHLPWQMHMASPPFMHGEPAG